MCSSTCPPLASGGAAGVSQPPSPGGESPGANPGRRESRASWWEDAAGVWKECLPGAPVPLEASSRPWRWRRRGPAAGAQIVRSRERSGFRARLSHSASVHPEGTSAAEARPGGQGDWSRGWGQQRGSLDGVPGTASPPPPASSWGEQLVRRLGALRLGLRWARLCRGAER